MALMPVCIGSPTGWRSATPGARNSTGRGFGRVERSLAVERAAQRIEHATDDRIADWHRQQLAGGADFVAFLNLQVVAENDDADTVLFEVERQPRHAAGKLDHLAGHHARQPIHASDAVADFEH